MSLVHEDGTDRAWTPIQVLVRAPGRPIDVGITERQLDVAGCVGQVQPTIAPAA